MNYEYTDSVKVLSNNTVVVTGKDNGKGYDWDPSRYFNWLRSLKQPERLHNNRLTQYNISNGNIVFSKTTDAKAVGEVTLDGTKCLVTCDW